MNIIKKLRDKIMNLDKKFKEIMKFGLKFSFAICIIAVSILFIYEIFYSIPNLFYIGISLLHTSLMFGCAFFMFGIGFDAIKNEIV